MIHLLLGKCFNIPHHCDPHLNQTKFNDLLPLTIPGVLGLDLESHSHSREKVQFFETRLRIIFLALTPGEIRF